MLNNKRKKYYEILDEKRTIQQVLEHMMYLQQTFDCKHNEGITYWYNESEPICILCGLYMGKSRQKHFEDLKQTYEDCIEEFKLRKNEMELLQKNE